MGDNVTKEAIELTAVDKFSDVLKQAQRQFKDLGSSIDTVKNALAAVGVTLGAGAMVALAKDIINATAALDDMAEQTGATVEGLSKIQTVAKIGGHEFAGVSDAMGKMIKGMKGANEEGQAASHALEFLGVKAKDANGRFRDSADILQDVARALAKYEDGGNKVALVQDLLGKGGARYLSLLKDMAEEGELQAKVTAQQAAEAEKFEKNMNRLKIALEDSKREFLMGITPALVDFTDKMLIAQRATGGLISALATLATSQSGGDIAGRIGQIESEIRSHEKNAEIAGKFGSMGWFGIAGIGAKLGAAGSGVNVGRLIAEREYLMGLLGRNARGLEDDLSGTWRGPSAPGRSTYTSPDKDKGPKPKTLDALLQETAGLDKDYYQDLKTLHDGYANGTITLERYRIAVEALTEKQRFAKDLDKAREVVLKGLNESAKLQAEELERQDAILAQFNTAMAQRVEQLEFENQLIEDGAAVTARAMAPRQQALELEAAANAVREKAIAFRQIDLELERQMVNATPEIVTALYERAAAEKARIGAAIDEKAARTLARDAAVAAAEEWKNAQASMWQSIDRTAHDTFVSILDSGKGAFDRLRDALKNGLYDLLYQMTVRPWIIQLSAAVSGGGVAQSAFGASAGGFNPLSLASSGSNLFGGGGMFSGLFGGGAGLTGSAVSAEIAALTGSGVSVGGALGTGAAAGIGAALPWIGGALAVGSMLGLFGDDGDKRKPSALGLKHEGGRFWFHQENVPGGEANLALYRRLEEELNDPARYDPGTLMGLLGMIEGGQGESAESMAERVMRRAAPAAGMATARTATRESLLAARDPTGYWGGRVSALGGELGTTATTVEQWRDEFLAALDDTLSQEQLTRWQQLGEAIERASQAAGVAANALSTSDFRTLVDYRRAVRLAGGVPRFAGGGQHEGGWRIVGEHGPEAEFTGPSAIVSNADTRRMFDLSGVVAELRALRNDMRTGHLAIARNTSASARLARRWDGDGLPVRGVDPETPIEVTVA